MRIFGQQIWIFGFGLLVWIGSSQCVYGDLGREIRPKSWQQDATINDTYWIDDQTGWAVGDQGLIVRTTDGGDTWIASQGAGQDLDDHRTLHQKISKMRPISRTHELVPLTCSFKSVYFADRKRGWIAGNYYTPYLNTSRSVLLATDDGGKSWTQLKGSILPGISRIYFQDVLGGWAIGRAGNVFKTGVFATSTGGRIWSVQDSDASGNWIDGELTAKGFVVIDDEGNLGRIVAGRYEASVIYGDRPGFMRSVRMLNSKVGWAVGAAGTVLQTKDGGMTWRRPPFVKDHQQLKNFDFESVAIAGDYVVFAGNPGSMIFKTDAEAANQIKYHATNFSLPIRRVYFSNEQDGCVVGVNGLIAVSNNGGKNWEQKRGIHDRLAVLSVTSQPNELPLGCLASFAGEQNRLVGNAIVGQHNSFQVELSKCAARRIGIGAHIEIRGDDTGNESKMVDSDRIIAELVRTIRTLRPSVLVCGQFDTEMELVCRTAIEQAASEEYCSNQIHSAGLTSWQVERFMSRRKNTAMDGIQFEGNTYLPRTGRLLEDQIAISLGTLNQSPTFSETEYYAVESFTGSVSVRGNDVFFGIAQLGQEVPERTEPTKLGNLNSIATAPLKNSEIKRLIKLAQGDEASQAEAQNQIQNFGSTQPARESGIWLMQLAERLVQVGQLDLAAAALEQLVNRYSNHSFAPAALMWLTQHYSSDEVTASIFAEYQRSVEESKQTKESSIETELEDSELMHASSIPVSAFDNGVRQVSWKPEPSLQKSSLNADSMKTIQSWRLKTASHYLERLKQTDLDFAQGPAIQFMEAMLVKKFPGDVSNQNLLKKIKRASGFQTEFRAAASRELKSRDKNYISQIPNCIRAHQRPKLDGVLNDPIWQNAMGNGGAEFKPVMLENDGAPTMTDVCWLANDDEFLFVAVRCNHAIKPKKRIEHGPRTRDPDLSSAERIQINLDFDRDLRSGFLFEIDSHGRAAESCCGSDGWNPDWYVAAGHDDKAWFLEIAIPLRDLMIDSVTEKTIAAFSISRLNSASVDLWAEGEDRLKGTQFEGLLAGLKFDPGKYQLLRFAVDAVSEEVDAVSEEENAEK